MSKKTVSKKWKDHKGFKKPFDYHLVDSDQDLTVRRLDMPDLLKLGVADQMDFMTKALMENPQSPDEAKNAVADAARKSGNFANLEVMINKIVLAGVIDPRLFPVPETGPDGADGPRDEDLMYIDEVPWDDRMELFSVIFESDGISDFREESQSDLGNVVDVQDVQLPPDGPVAELRSDEPEGVLSQSGDLQVL